MARVDGLNETMIHAREVADLVTQIRERIVSGSDSVQIFEVSGLDTKPATRQRVSEQLNAEYPGRVTTKQEGVRSRIIIEISPGKK